MAPPRPGSGTGLLPGTSQPQQQLPPEQGAFPTWISKTPALQLSPKCSRAALAEVEADTEHTWALPLTWAMGTPVSPPQCWLWEQPLV